jgi:hypothetical protein
MENGHSDALGGAYFFTVNLAEQVGSHPPWGNVILGFLRQPAYARASEGSAHKRGTLAHTFV